MASASATPVASITSKCIATAIKHARPEHGVINNRFGLLRVALCAPTDDEAVELQEPNYPLFYEQMTRLLAPWLEGKPPPTYEYIIQSHKEQLATGQTYSMKELVEAGQAIIGSPETCVRFINKLIEAGVDEILLFMQGAVLATINRKGKIAQNLKSRVWMAEGAV